MKNTLEQETYQVPEVVVCVVLQVASAWWGGHMKALQRQGGLGKQALTGMASLQAVLGAPGFFWPAQADFRRIGSGGQGTVY